MERGIAGLSHHRWLIEIKGGKIEFMQKYHAIHSWRRSLPRSVLRNTQERDAVQWMFWEDRFDFAEIVLHGNAQVANLESFVARTKPHPTWLLRTDDMAQHLIGLVARISAAVQRRLICHASRPKVGGCWSDGDARVPIPNGDGSKPVGEQ